MLLNEIVLYESALLRQKNNRNDNVYAPCCSSNGSVLNTLPYQLPMHLLHSNNNAHGPNCKKLILETPCQRMYCLWVPWIFADKIRQRTNIVLYSLYYLYIQYMFWPTKIRNTWSSLFLVMFLSILFQSWTPAKHQPHDIHRITALIPRLQKQHQLLYLYY